MKTCQIFFKLNWTDKGQDIKRNQYNCLSKHRRLGCLSMGLFVRLFVTTFILNHKIQPYSGLACTREGASESFRFHNITTTTTTKWKMSLYALVNNMSSEVRENQRINILGYFLTSVKYNWKRMYYHCYETQIWLKCNAIWISSCCSFNWNPRSVFNVNSRKCEKLYNPTVSVGFTHP